MRRRTLLRLAGGAGIGWLAGCTATGPDDGSDGTSTQPTGTASFTERSSASPTPCATRVTATSFSVREVECGTGENAADASVQPTGAGTPETDGAPPTYTVTVTGTIDGADTCHSARLAGVESRPDEDTLRVAVASYVPDSNQTVACGQCIVDVDYEATVELACGYAGVVTVVHDGEPVAEIPLPE
jgi:hypothetical protein